MRRGSEVRKSVNVSVKAIKKVREASTSIPPATFNPIRCCQLKNSAEHNDQVLGKPHPHLAMLKELHQGYRDLHVSLATAGSVLFICRDDLQRMPLDVRPRRFSPFRALRR